MVNNIIIEETGIYAASKDIFDTIHVDGMNNTVLYDYPNDINSFWYKIYVTVDCKVTFEIFPSGPDNRYNYFLYQKRGDLSTEEIYATDSEPVRASLYEDNMNKGIGLSLSSSVSSNDSCPRNIGDIYYHTRYQSALSVRAGDILLLNIYHLKGNDCGQRFVLKDNKHSRDFKSLYESCYNDQAAVKKIEHLLNLYPLFVQKIPTKIKATFLVKDSIRNNAMDAAITCIKQCKEVSDTVHAEINGSYETILQKNTSYKIIFSAFGYQNKILAFSTTDSLSPLNMEILLALIKAGDSFVMDKIYFYPNTYVMRPGASAEVDKLLKYLLANPDIKVEIQGFTNGNNRIKASPDDIGEGSFTGSAKKLSQLRAETIKKYLSDKGVSADRMLTNGFGGSQMIYQNPKTQEEANKNIRVGVLILSQKEAALSSNNKTK